MNEAKFNFIPSIDAGPEEIKKIKNEINSEGREGNSLIQIGTEKEQAEFDIRRKIEKENYIDLESYIRGEKKIIVPREDLNKFYEEFYEQGNSLLTAENMLYYIDSNGNIAMVDIDPKRINIYAHEPSEICDKKISERLFELGFHGKGSVGDNVLMSALVIQSQQYQNTKKEKKNNFDF